jgi:8-oxo-dGTP diphosphatase
MDFIYKEEYWYISSFLNSTYQDNKIVSKNIEIKIKERLKNINKEDIYVNIRDEFGDDIIDMAKNITLSCTWVPYLENFPYKDENNQRKYDTLGFFQFEVEYYKENPTQKEDIKPSYIQQIPQIIKSFLGEFSLKKESKGILFDLESPIYIFVISDKIKPDQISWTEDNIEKYKRTISYWTAIYSGQWEDYSEVLYDKRIENNLSNRLTELHFIRRNSGFIYMAKENFVNFFDSYMKDFVLIPTPKMRAVQFALRIMNESLDLLFLETQLEEFKDVDTIEKKIRNLRILRGLIQTKLSLVYNELDYNRREHYTEVLKHLLTEFEIDGIVTRINNKFITIYDSIQGLYIRKNEEIQKKTEKGLNLLNLLFGAGILADLGSVIMIALSLQEGDPSSILLNSIIAIIITGILVTTIAFNIYTKIQVKKGDIIHAVDAIIEDEGGNVVLVKRKFPPFQGYYALPGGSIEKGEEPEDAVIREVMEETNLKVEPIEKIGLYNEEGRDPRGTVHSNAYKCKLLSSIADMHTGEEILEVKLFSKEQIKEIELAFDHKKMLRDCNFI